MIIRKNIIKNGVILTLLVILGANELYIFYKREIKKHYLHKCKIEIAIGKIYKTIQSSSIKNGFFEIDYFYKVDGKLKYGKSLEIGKIEEWDNLENILKNKELPVAYCIDSMMISELIFYKDQFQTYNIKVDSNYNWVKKFW